MSDEEDIFALSKYCNEAAYCVPGQWSISYYKDGVSRTTVIKGVATAHQLFLQASADSGSFQPDLKASTRSALAG